MADMNIQDPRWDSERAWARNQLSDANATEEEVEFTMRLLEAWFNGFDSDLLDGSVWNSLKYFDTLARGKAIEPEPDAPEDKEVWVPAKAGSIRVGNIVRVRTDAFEPDSENTHHYNGKRGRVVGFRVSVVRVKLDDSDPGVPFSQFRMPQLEVKVPAS